LKTDTRPTLVTTSSPRIFFRNLANFNLKREFVTEKKQSFFLVWPFSAKKMTVTSISAMQIAHYPLHIKMIHGWEIPH
jgi:hypothetical protein